MHKAPRSPPPYDVSICVRTSSIAGSPSSRPARPWSLGRCTRLRTPSTRHGVRTRPELLRASVATSRPEGSPGRFRHLSGRMSRKLPGLSGMLLRLCEACTSTGASTSRVHQSSSLFMESCFRSLATGQHCGSTGQRIHYFPGQLCGCRLCLRADLYKNIYEAKVQDALRRADPPRRTDQG